MVERGFDVRIIERFIRLSFDSLVLDTFDGILAGVVVMECPTKPTRENLHAIWDDCLVDVVTGADHCVSHTTDRQVEKLAALLKRQVGQQEAHAYRSTGNYHHWPEEWATDTLQMAANRVFTFELADGCVITSPKPPHRALHVQSRIVAPPTKEQYLHAHRYDAEIQLTKAAVRLADLLRQIQWK